MVTYRKDLCCTVLRSMFFRNEKNYSPKDLFVEAYLNRFLMNWNRVRPPSFDSLIGFSQLDLFLTL